MCSSDASPLLSALFGQPNLSPGPVLTGSRRRRIWELPVRCHCPLVGVCLPLQTLRRLVNRAAGGEVQGDDYEVHVGSVSECVSRNRLSEALQNELERRYMQTISRFRQAKTTEAVQVLWIEAVNKGDVAGALWAALTHPRCDPALQEMLCRDMHMLQHQAGACIRADISRLNALAEQNALLASRFEEGQRRTVRLLGERDEELRSQEAQCARLRSELIGKEAQASALNAELAALKASIPNLESRARLQEKIDRLTARAREANAQIALLQQAPAPLHPAGLQPEPEAPSSSAPVPLDLHDRSVLCVGGRSGSVATYRELIEGVGGKFAHHDGGREDNVRQLETTLAAADLVICQTGCISHQAYWRVKDYCKRHGKRCVFVDNPSISSLARSMNALPDSVLNER